MLTTRWSNQRTTIERLYKAGDVAGALAIAEQLLVETSAAYEADECTDEVSWWENAARNAVERLKGEIGFPDRQPIKIAYIARLLAQFGLPYRPLADGENEWLRTNGKLQCRIVNVAGRGIASGSTPRLLMAWLATWCIAHPDLEVVDLGKNITRFLRADLGLNVCGDSIRAARRQLIQLFTSVVSVTADPSDSDCAPFVFEPCALSKKVTLWGLSHEQDAFFPSCIELNPEFRESILEHPIPVNRAALLSLKRWPLALDLYCWAAYRFCTLRQPTRISWQQLAQQFGTACASTRQGDWDFRQQVVQQLRRVRAAYPAAKIEIGRDGIQLYPSPTPIPATKTFSFRVHDSKRET